MKLAHILPQSLLECGRGGDAFLCLSNLVMADDAYAAFHRDRAEKGSLVILDNPVHEDGVVDIDWWLEAAQRVRPSVAIIPDVIDDVEATVALATDLRKEMREACPTARLMAVPHGIEHHHFHRCAMALGELRDPMIDWFGVSLERRLGEDAVALHRRVKRLRILNSEPSLSKRPVHLLGISEKATELLSGWTDAFAGVVSADTSKFAVWQLLGATVLPPPPVPIEYPGRAALGGSQEYFEYVPGRHFDHQQLTRVLDDWSQYARPKLRSAQ
jgi:hypothetical protein